MLFKELSHTIIGCFYRVHNALGPGLLELPYHNALYYEIKKQGFKVSLRVPFNVIYDQEIVGEYFADLVVENKVIIEVKSVCSLSKEHEAQLLNYLHISKVSLGFLVNFRNSSVEFKRFVVTRE